MGPPHPPLNPFGSSSFTHTYSFSSSASALASTVPIVPIPILPQKVSQSVAQDTVSGGPFRSSREQQGRRLLLAPLHLLQRAELAEEPRLHIL